ncbi:MAG: hypothetical protein NZV14_09590 [Bryobacteraceae bacterium]|nr:hypothetical protein [Bryobacteraceae bacterium]MDW8378404.1 hypothetical protein [Bryobacterales bacterium]
MRQLGITLAAVVLSSCLAQAGDLMHCFAFTPIAEATQADWDAFYKATYDWPKKHKAIKMVWAGKLLRPLVQFGTSDAEARKKALAGEKGVTAPLTVTRREYGVCMAFDGTGDPAQILKTYASHPYHKEWTATYEKVRVPGTTTYDIVSK